METHLNYLTIMQIVVGRMRKKVNLDWVWYNAAGNSFLLLVRCDKHKGKAEIMADL